MSETHSIPLEGAEDLIVSVALPAGAQDGSNLLPAVLIFPTWAGRNAFVEDKAKALAELGYIGIAADVYGGGKTGNNAEECSALMNPLMTNRTELRRRLLALVDGMATTVPGVNPDRIAAIGYCFGGLCALDLARSGAKIQGVVSFHGLFQTPPHELKAGATGPVAAKVLALHGYDDPMVQPKALTALADEFTAADADWQIHAYGGNVHAFTNPAANDAAAGTVYDTTADRRSWQSMRSFLDELFGDDSPAPV